MLKWDDLMTSEASMLFTIFPEKVRELDEMIASTRGDLLQQGPTVHLNVSEVKDGSQQSADLPGVVLGEGEDLQRRAEVGVLLHVVPPLADGAVSLVGRSDE